MPRTQSLPQDMYDALFLSWLDTKKNIVIVFLKSLLMFATALSKSSGTLPV